MTKMAGILGKPLTRVPQVFVKECGYIPSVLYNAEEYIDKHLDTKDVFQVQGSSTKVANILLCLSSPRGFSRLTKTDVHDVVEAVKTFLVRLPEPLLTDQVCDKLIEASQADRNLGEILVDLRLTTPAHFAVLHFLMRLLAKVANRSHKNSMDVRKLATIFVLDILKPLKINDTSDVPLSFPTDRMKRLPYLIMVIEHLMENPDLFQPVLAQPDSETSATVLRPKNTGVRNNRSASMPQNSRARGRSSNRAHSRTASRTASAPGNDLHDVHYKPGDISENHPVADLSAVTSSHGEPVHQTSSDKSKESTIGSRNSRVVSKKPKGRSNTRDMSRSESCSRFAGGGCRRRSVTISGGSKITDTCTVAEVKVPSRVTSRSRIPKAVSSVTGSRSIASNGSRRSSTSNGLKPLTSSSSAGIQSEIRDLLKDIVDLAKQESDEVGVAQEQGDKDKLQRQRVICETTKCVKEERKDSTSTKTPKQCTRTNSWQVGTRRGISVNASPKKKRPGPSSSLDNSLTKSKNNVESKINQNCGVKKKPRKACEKKPLVWGNGNSKKVKRKIPKGGSQNQSVTTSAYSSFQPGEEMGPWQHSGLLSDTERDISVLNKTIQEPRVLDVSPVHTHDLNSFAERRRKSVRSPVINGKNGSPKRQEECPGVKKGVKNMHNNGSPPKHSKSTRNSKSPKKTKCASSQSPRKLGKGKKKEQKGNKGSECSPKDVSKLQQCSESPPEGRFLRETNQVGQYTRDRSLSPVERCFSRRSNSCQSLEASLSHRGTKKSQHSTSSLCDEVLHNSEEKYNEHQRSLVIDDHHKSGMSFENYDTLSTLSESSRSCGRKKRRSPSNKRRKRARSKTPPSLSRLSHVSRDGSCSSCSRGILKPSRTYPDFGFTSDSGSSSFAVAHPAALPLMVQPNLSQQECRGDDTPMRLFRERNPRAERFIGQGSETVSVKLQHLVDLFLILTFVAIACFVVYESYRSPRSDPD